MAHRVRGGGDRGPLREGAQGRLAARLGLGRISRCTAAHSLYTKFTHIFGTSISETPMRPNPRRGPPPVNADGTPKTQRGLISMADMAGTVAAIEPAIAYDYKGWTVGKCGPWSQGPVLLQCLALLKVRNHGVFSLVALHGLCAVLKISRPRAQGIRAREDAAGLPGVHPHRRRAPLAVPTPMNRSWGPRNIYCCESLW